MSDLASVRSISIQNLQKRNETPSAIKKDNDKSLKEPVPQYGTQIAQVEENQIIQLSPILISQISIPLD